jgi:signal transduction histidine kinase
MATSSRSKHRFLNSTTKTASFTRLLRDISLQVDAERSLQRSHEELRELSAKLLNIREEEKSRIARELHDDLGQQLTALKMDISSLELAPGTDAEARAQLRGMQRLIDATVASMGRIAADLRPVMLDDLGLVPAIDWLAIDFTNRYGIDVRGGSMRGIPFSAATALPLCSGSCRRR